MTGSRIAAAIVIVVLAGLALPISNLIVGLPTSVTLGSGSEGSREFMEASRALSMKCANCHTSKGKIPFYANFPIARAIMQRDIRMGTEYLDFESEFGSAPKGAVREVPLAKIEYSVERGTMPPMRYMVMHWNGALTSDESRAVLNWIRKERSENYASGASPQALRGNVLQPLPPQPTLDARKVSLGERLYGDKRLSKDNTISCASCHDFGKGGTDGEQFSDGVGGAKGDINSPTVFNAALQIAQFWDGRARDLQEQADGPVNNPAEMASNWPEVISKLERDVVFKARFEVAYPDGFSGGSITDAIATFEKTLITQNSAFDRYLLGDTGALNEEAKRGHEEFLNKACATCHVGMAMGGQSYEKMGRDDDYFAARGNVGKADLGRFNVTKVEQDRHKFKVPMLRNVALTGPYFHDGTVETLEEATELMAKYQLGVDLSSRQTKRIVAFLQSLTGEYGGSLLK